MKLTQPTFVIVSRFHIPADGPWDPARSWSQIEGYAETAGWARVIAARASLQYCVDDSDYGYDDRYCGTDVMVRSARYVGHWERVLDCSPVMADEDIPF